MGNTSDNLKEAFAGESQANRKYLAFAKKADEEGYPQAARLFRAAAAAETVHAHNHFNVLDGVKSTAENLKAAYEGEHFEFTKMYPEFLEIAKKEGNNDAFKSFHWANEVEKMYGEAGEPPRITTMWGLWFLLPLIGQIIWYVRIQNALNEFWQARGGSTSPGLA